MSSRIWAPVIPSRDLWYPWEVPLVQWTGVHGSCCHWPVEQGEAWELGAQPLSAQMGSVFLLRAVWEAQFPLVSLSGGDAD